MSDLGHNQAMDCIIGAAGVTVLSYEEAITAYFGLRGLTIPPDPRPTPPTGEGSPANKGGGDV